MERERINLRLTPTEDMEIRLKVLPRLFPGSSWNALTDKEKQRVKDEANTAAREAENEKFRKFHCLPQPYVRTPYRPKKRKDV